VHRYDHAENEVKARGNSGMPIQGGNNEPFVNTSFIYQHLDGIFQTVVHSQLKNLSEMVHFSHC
jgi:hypothetical protein